VVGFVVVVVVWVDIGILLWTRRMVAETVPPKAIDLQYPGVPLEMIIQRLPILLRQPTVDSSLLCEIGLCPPRFVWRIVLEQGWWWWWKG